MSIEGNPAPAEVQQQSPTMPTLPAEVMANIHKYLGKKHLKKVRLANRELNAQAARELFRNVRFSPTQADLSRWKSISETESIRRLVHHVTIHTQPDIDDYDAEDGEADECQEEFEDEAIPALSKFPNLTELEIGFHVKCVGDRETEWYEDCMETVSRRQELLQIIFSAAAKRAEVEEENAKIRSLTLVNLQNATMDFTDSDLFRDVMGQLDELHLSMIQEYCEAGPDHDYTREELRTFPSQLRDKWLRPIAHNLKSLSLYSKTDNWGPFPGYFDATTLAFPRLETLSLGYYTIAHDKDLDWILAQKSLKRLVLHNAMIASYIRIDEANMPVWNVNTTDWQAMAHNDPNDTFDRCFEYHGKWSTFLDKLTSELPNLVDICFDCDTEYGGTYGVHARHQEGATISPRRYVVFDNGILPTHWPEADDDGELHTWMDDPFPNLHIETLKDDAKSLERLLEQCRKRAQGVGLEK